MTNTYDDVNDLREELAADALENADFGDAVADCGPWEKDGDVWSCKIYLDDQDYDDTVLASFTVWFEGDKVVESAWDLI